LFSFRYTSDVCKRVVQDGAKIELQTLVHTLTKYWWILPILSVLCPANFNEDLWHITERGGYTTLKKWLFAKIVSTKHS